MLNTSSVGGVSKRLLLSLRQKNPVFKNQENKPCPTVYDTEHKVRGCFVLLAYTKSDTHRELFKYNLTLSRATV